MRLLRGSSCSSCLLPYTRHLSDKLELQWSNFRSSGVNAVFMLQESPGQNWQINFFRMIQKNIDVSCSTVALC
jgi:hypothetical protein